MNFWNKLKSFIRKADELATGNDGYVIPIANHSVPSTDDSGTLDSFATIHEVGDSLVTDLSLASSNMNKGEAAAPSSAVQTKGSLMFNFNHSESELRDIVQAIEGKIASLQAHLQRLITSANAQAQLQNGQPAAADPTPTVTVPVDTPVPTSVDLSADDAGTVTVSS